MTQMFSSFSPSLAWKWKLFIVAVVMTFITGVMYEIDPASQLTRIRPKPALAVPRTSNAEKTIKGSNLMILSYMRGGSTMNGRVFGENSENFYVFEPLIPLAPHHYLTEKWLCNMKDRNCRSESEDDKNNKTATGLTPIDKVSARMLRDKAIQTLKNIYTCRIKNLDDAILRRIMFEHKNDKSKSGEAWTNFTSCYVNLVEPNVTNMDNYLETARTTEFDKHRHILRLLTNTSPALNMFRKCLNKLESHCRNTELRVTKVLRLSLRFLPLLMTEIPDLKVLFIIRDPRGIINSRIQTKWYPVSEGNPKSVRGNIESLCFKIQEDIKTIETLKTNFPRRFLELTLEDAVKEPSKSFRKIFKFGALNMTRSYSRKIKSLFGEKPTFLSRWTSTLNHEYKNWTDKNCWDALTRYGYDKYYENTPIHIQ